jgi:predicted deacylase
VLEGPLEGLPSSVRIIENLGFVHAPSGGFLRTTVSLGESVVRDQVLGVLVDLLGEPTATIRAPADAIVNDVRVMPRVLPGEWLYLLGTVVREVSPADGVANWGAV